MKILVTNDDGINAPGLKKLVEKAVLFGDVTVIAPASQCSAMSQKLTIASKMWLERVDFPIPVKAAYALCGTPADCIKLGIYSILSEKPDIVFSGINAGFNTGTDIAYSGTVGAAMESLIEGVPAIAFSTGFTTNYAAVDKYLVPVTKEILEKEIGKNEIWNVNIPDIAAMEIKGVLWNRRVGQRGFYDNYYSLTTENETPGPWEPKMKPSDVPALHERLLVGISAVPVDYHDEDTDVYAVRSNYVSVGKLRSVVIDQ